MDRVYSETFILMTVNGSMYSITVPAGYRAVIKSVTSWSDHTAAATAAAYVNGVGIYRSNVPAGGGTQTETLYVVAYGGWTISGYLGALKMGLSISGYLFKDDPAAGDAVWTEELTMGEPIPPADMATGCARSSGS